jgi:hypothetical protein
MWPFRRKRKMTEAEFLRMVICLVTYDQQDIKLQPPPPREPLQEVDRTVGELITPTPSLHARIRHRRSGGDDPCSEDLSRDNRMLGPARAWWPTSGGAQARV